MYRDRAELEKIIQKIIKNKSTSKNDINKSKNALVEIGVPEKTANEIMLLIKPLNLFSDQILFKTCEVLSSTSIKSFFTPQEIKEYSKVKINKDKVFPIHWKMIQIDGRQFIGKISVKELMKLRDNQLLNYNSNTQRPAKAIEVDEGYIYVPSVNMKSVNSIKELLKERLFVPNTITLNIPAGDEYLYDSENLELIIPKIDHFDILDGYHRFRALSDMYNLEEDFDYTMELRVISFTEDRARQFIYQEDQKNKMKKMVSQSFNTLDRSNEVVKELNDFSVWKGKINDKGIIDPALAARMISITFLSGKTNSTRRDVVEASQYIENCIRRYEINNLDSTEKIWDARYIVSFFYAIWKTKEIGIENLDKLVKDVYNISQDEKYKRIFKPQFTKGDLNRLDKVAKEVLDYV